MIGSDPTDQHCLVPAAERLNAFALVIYIADPLGGFLDDLPVNQVRDFEKELYEYVDATAGGVLRAIMEKKVLDDGLKAQLTDVIKQAKQQFVASREAVAK